MVILKVSGIRAVVAKKDAGSYSFSMSDRLTIRRLDNNQQEVISAYEIDADKTMAECAILNGWKSP